MKIVADKELRRLLRDCERQGLVVAKRRNGHLKVTNPETGEVVYMSSTPRSGGTIHQQIKWLVKIGFDPGTRRKA